MAAHAFSNATAQTVSQVLSKLNDQAPDLPFMSLNDIHSILTHSPQALSNNDYNTSSRVVEGILKSLRDPNTEVRMAAIKWYCPRGQIGKRTANISPVSILWFQSFSHRFCNPF